MNHRHFIAAISVLGLFATHLAVYAQEMDIEQADSLNFQSFHKDKKEAVKVWDKQPETTKAYSERPDEAKTTQTAASNAVMATTAPTAKAGDVAGKRFEMRERYTLTRSTQTPFSAFYVIEPLYRQAAQLCPKGWQKLAERSEPIEQDFYLYYEIECL